MLGTTALVAILMLGMLSVIGTVGKSQALLRRHHAQDSFPPRVVQMIRLDLLHARNIQADKGRLELSGYGALDPQTLTPTFRGAKVVYRLELLGNQSWLVREQTVVSDLGSNRTWKELVCGNVAVFDLTNRKLPEHATLVIESSIPGVAPLQEEITLQ